MTVRDYSKDDKIREFYFKQHSLQTVAYVKEANIKYNPMTSPFKKMKMWDALIYLSNVTDESDPDTSNSQLQHGLQTAESMRRNGESKEMQLVGLIHDAGKMLEIKGAESWSIVGDTFPVGCKFSDSIVYGRDSFRNNPDFSHEIFSTELGIYEKNCGISNLIMSYGHDEYLRNVLDSYLPRSATDIIRYHSFYSWHKEHSYEHFMNIDDFQMREKASAFSKYDLYSKLNECVDTSTMEYFEDIVSDILPMELVW